MSINNRVKDPSGHIEDYVELGVKPKFVPKRRTPYLMQEEVIKQKEEAEALKKEEQKIIDNKHLPEKVNSSQLDVNKMSIGSLPDRVSQLSIKEEPFSTLGVDKESISSQCDLNFYEEATRLYGLQKKIAHFFVQCCIQRNQNKTGPVTAETLCNITGSTKKTIKKIIQRMTDKHLVKRFHGKRGKGGFTTFEIEQKFIDVVRLQIDLELNHMTSNNQFTNISAPVLNNQNILPNDWERIDLNPLLDAFKNSSSKVTQFFGKSQLKIIYTFAGNRLSSLDVQRSINSFSYGLKNYSKEEPYRSMVNPAAILLDTLKNGDQWEEKKYLSTEELSLYKVYINISKKVQEDLMRYYTRWKEIDKDKKIAYYKGTMRSTDYFDDRVFEEKALEDYKKNIWAKEKKSIIRDIMAFTDESILDKFELIQI